MILVPLLNPKFATAPAAKSCELRVRGTRAATSRKFLLIYEGLRAPTGVAFREIPQQPRWDSNSPESPGPMIVVNDGDKCVLVALGRRICARARL
jgi:hypothetical protein